MPMSENIHACIFFLPRHWKHITIIIISQGPDKSSFESTVAEMNQRVELTMVQQTVPALPVIMQSACCSPVKRSAVRGPDAWWRANTEPNPQTLRPPVPFNADNDLTRGTADF